MYFFKPKSTYDQLYQLSREIKLLESKRVFKQSNEDRMLKIITYPNISFTVMYTLACYFYNEKLVSIISGSSKTDSFFYKIFIWFPVFLIPIIVYYTSLLVKFYYAKNNQKWVRNVIQKRILRKQMLDNVAETCTYNDCIRIFEEFDRSRLNQFTDNKFEKNRKVFRSGQIKADNLIKQPTKGLSEKAKVHTFNTRASLKTAENERKVAAEERRKAAILRNESKTSETMTGGEEIAEFMRKYAEIRKNNMIGVPIVKKVD